MKLTPSAKKDPTFSKENYSFENRKWNILSLLLILKRLLSWGMPLTEKTGLEKVMLFGVADHTDWSTHLSFWETVPQEIQVCLAEVCLSLHSNPFWGHELEVSVHVALLVKNRWAIQVTDTKCQAVWIFHIPFAGVMKLEVSHSISIQYRNKPILLPHALLLTSSCFRAYTIFKDFDSWWWNKSFPKCGHWLHGIWLPRFSNALLLDLNSSLTWRILTDEAK